MSEAFPLSWIKAATMTPLQQQVYELGVCASCHTRSMRLVHHAPDAGLAFWQCNRYNRVAMLECTAHNTEVVKTTDSWK